MFEKILTPTSMVVVGVVRPKKRKAKYVYSKSFCEYSTLTIPDGEVRQTSRVSLVRLSHGSQLEEP